MDWLADFKSKYQDKPLIAELRKEKFHGNVMINFSDGIVMNCKMNFTLMPSKEDSHE